MAGHNKYSGKSTQTDGASMVAGLCVCGGETRGAAALPACSALSELGPWVISTIRTQRSMMKHDFASVNGEQEVEHSGHAHRADRSMQKTTPEQQFQLWDSDVPASA